MNFIMVLDDGETCSNLDGCCIYYIPEGMSPEEIEERISRPADNNEWDYIFRANRERPTITRNGDSLGRSLLVFEGES